MKDLDSLDLIITEELELSKELLDNFGMVNRHLGNRILGLPIGSDWLNKPETRERIFSRKIDGTRYFSVLDLITAARKRSQRIRAQGKGGRAL